MAIDTLDDLRQLQEPREGSFSYIDADDLAGRPSNAAAFTEAALDLFERDDDMPVDAWHRYGQVILRSDGTVEPVEWEHGIKPNDRILTVSFNPVRSAWHMVHSNQGRRTAIIAQEVPGDGSVVARSVAFDEQGRYRETGELNELESKGTEYFLRYLIHTETLPKILETVRVQREELHDRINKLLAEAGSDLDSRSSDVTNSALTDAVSGTNSYQEMKALIKRKSEGIGRLTQESVTPQTSTDEKTRASVFPKQFRLFV